MAALLLGIVALAAAFGFDKIAVPGSTYTVSANTVRYTFRLDSAAFATEFVGREGHVFAPRGRKMLIVRYTVGNPQTYSLSVNRGLVQLGVAEDKKEEIGLHGARSLDFLPQSQDLGAGKTFSDTAYLEISNTNQTPQLVVRVGGSEALRYDLSGRVKPHAGPYAQSHGLVSVDDAAAKPGEAVATGAFEIAVDRATLGRTPVSVKLDNGIVAETIEPGNGERILIALVKIKNRTKSDQRLDGAIFAEVKDSTDAKGPIFRRILDKDLKRLEGTLKPGSTAIVQIVFVLPASFTPASLTVFDEIGGRRSVTVRNFIR